MAAYLHWDDVTLDDISPHAVQKMYDSGYVFTRIGKSIMHQTRSLRIDLSKFELSSENRRILRKTDSMDIREVILPYEQYTWLIGKMAKDFYENKFGEGVMSANKIKELLTNSAKSNFNTLYVYTKKEKTIGYAICYATNKILHYSYPFYDLAESSKDMGMGMMLKTITLAKEQGLLYVYLGSLQRPGDIYKLQFSGLEWFDGGAEGTGTWNTDMEKAKEILK
jgi:arginyl-tRNA--protein-N-Asp/Glu arginylyltransferase